MTDSRKRILKWVGYPLLAIVVYVFGIHYMFPYERVKDRLKEAMSEKYDIDIGEISPGWLPGRFTITGLTLTTRPTNELEKPVTLAIDKVDLNVGLIALLFKKVSVDINATLGDGEVKGHVSISDDGLSIDMDTKDLPLESIPGVGVITGGAPIKGGLEVHVNVDVPQQKWMMANGEIDMTCSACTIGDGVTKVHAPGQVNAFNAEGFTLPRIKLGQLTGKVTIKQGIACIEQFASKSSHGEVQLEGGVRLSDPVAQSQAQLYARVKLTEEFKAEAPKNGDVEILMGAGARTADGWLAYSAKSPLGAMRWVAAPRPVPSMRECPSASGAMAPPEKTTPVNKPLTTRQPFERPHITRNPPVAGGIEPAPNLGQPIPVTPPPPTVVGNPPMPPSAEGAAPTPTPGAETGAAGAPPAPAPGAGEPPPTPAPTPTPEPSQPEPAPPTPPAPEPAPQ